MCPISPQMNLGPISPPETCCSWGTRNNPSIPAASTAENHFWCAT
jgi:hypothetical protein